MKPRTLLAVLGAGDSRRMGQAKILMETGGQPNLLHILDSARAAGISEALIACRDTHLSSLQSLGLPRQSLYPVPETLRALGPIGSLTALLSRLQAPKGDTHSLSGDPPEKPSPQGLITGILVWPVDHPWVLPSTLKSLLLAGGPLRVPTHGGRRGHPVWVGREFFAGIPELAKEGKTLRALFQEPEARVTFVPVSDPGILRNLNRPEDV